MEVRVARLSLQELDALAGVDLLLFVSRDERPLQGLPGLVDWRLCGGLSRSLRADVFAGVYGESLLTVPAGLLPANRVFLLGTGSRSELDEGRALDAIGEALHAIRRAGGTRVATAPPMPGARALAELVAEGVQAGLQGLVLLVPDPKVAEEHVAAAARAHGAVLAARASLPGSASVLRSKP